MKRSMIISNHLFLHIFSKEKHIMLQCRKGLERLLGHHDISAKPDCPSDIKSKLNRWHYLWHIPDSENTEEHLSESGITPVLSTNTPITHAKQRQCKQCRTILWISSCSGLSDWLDRSLEGLDVIGGEERHIDWRIIRVKLAWSSSIIQRKDLGWDSLRSEVWCTFHSLRVWELHRNGEGVCLCACICVCVWQGGGGFRSERIEVTWAQTRGILWTSCVLTELMPLVLYSLYMHVLEFVFLSLWT